MAIPKFLLLFSFSLLLLSSNVLSASLLSNTNNHSNTPQVPPSPSPLPLQLLHNTTQPSTNLTNHNADLKQSNTNLTATETPVTTRNETNGGNQNDSQTDKELKRDSEGGKTEKPNSDGRNCTGVSRRCTDQKSLLACILDYQPGSKEILVLVQNDGEKNLSVDLSGSNHRDDALLEIPTHGSRQINLLVGNEPVILRAGNGACILHPELPTSEGNFFLNLPSYDQLITPINGAYFLIVTVIVFGGTCAFCSLRKRRRPGGVAYRKLEMSLPETGTVNDEELAEGWDQGWDDDWDEENAVKSPAARRAAGSISADGLTSRATNKDGWENDWDN